MRFTIYLVRERRLELLSLSAMASKTIVYTIPPLALNAFYPSW